MSVGNYSRVASRAEGSVMMIHRSSDEGVLRWEAHCGSKTIRTSICLTLNHQQSSELTHGWFAGSVSQLVMIVPPKSPNGPQLHHTRHCYMRQVVIPVPMARTLSEPVMRHFRLHTLPGSCPEGGAAGAWKNSHRQPLTQRPGLPMAHSDSSHYATHG
jgi:hypothetical protein